MVKNYMEILVEQYLNELLTSDPKYKDVCRCAACIDDIEAKALNHLPPFYVTGKKGEIFGEYHARNFQNKMDIMSAIVAAIEFIHTHRDHEPQLKV